MAESMKDYETELEASFKKIGNAAFSEEPRPGAGGQHLSFCL